MLLRMSKVVYGYYVVKDLTLLHSVVCAGCYMDPRGARGVAALAVLVVRGVGLVVRTVTAH